MRGGPIRGACRLSLAAMEAAAGAATGLAFIIKMRSGKAVAFSEARSERLGRADVSKLAGALGLGWSQAGLTGHAVRID